MLWAAVLLAGTASQAKVEIDGQQRRRVYEAARAATYWATRTSRVLFPASRMANENDPARRAFLYNESVECERALRIAALHQVCDAYKMKPKDVQAIIDDPAEAMRYPHDPEKPRPIGVSPDSQRWKLDATLFNPEKVRLHPRLAKRFGYKNPPPGEFNRRSASQDLKDQLLNSPGP